MSQSDHPEVTGVGLVLAEPLTAHSAVLVLGYGFTIAHTLDSFPTIPHEPREVVDTIRWRLRFIFSGVPAVERCGVY